MLYSRLYRSITFNSEVSRLSRYFTSFQCGQTLQLPLQFSSLRLRPQISLSLKCSGPSSQQIRRVSYFPNFLNYQPALNRFSFLSLPNYGQAFSRMLHISGVARADNLVVVSSPAFAESITEGDVKISKAVGDSIKVDEVIAEIETDKTSIPVPSPVAGVVTEILIANGSKITAKQPILKVRTGAGAAATSEAAAAPSTAKAPGPPPPPSKGVRGEDVPVPKSMPPVPPLPKQPLSERSIGSITPLTTPPPKVSAVHTPVASTQKGVPGVDFIAGSRGEHRVKMSRMRLRIAQRLKDAQNTAAMLTTFNECDLSNLMEMRKKYADQFQKKHNMKLGFMGAFVRASAYALNDQPIINAMIDDATNETVYRDYVDISVAVATPKGLVVPVVRGAERMSFAEVEKEISRLGEKARLNQLAIEDMDGGTFTISNGGIFGGLFGTPIINPPQSAILGMYGIQDRVIAINGKPEVRPMMYLALSYDHRLIDGREAVTFLRKIKSVVEDPRLLFLDL